MFKTGLDRKSRYSSKLVSYFYDLFVLGLTPMGRSLVVAGVLLLIFATVIINATFLLYSIIAFYFFVFIAAPLAGIILTPKISLKVNTPRRAAAGSVVYEEITLENKSKRDANLLFVRQDLHLADVFPEDEQGVIIPLLKKGERTGVKLGLCLAKRGDYSLESLRVESTFPFGISKSGYRHNEKRNLLVYPNFKPLSEFDIPAGKKLQPGGIALASKLGESTEFMGTREYRYGDSPRYIHWRSWARVNRPIIKEFQEEYYARIALFIDTFVPPKSSKNSYEAFESLLSLGASVSDYLARQEYIIDILAAGPDIYYLQAGRSLAYLDQILDILACVDVCREKPYNKIEPHLMQDLSRISTVIVLLLGWDDERRDFLLRINEMGVDMKIFIISNDNINMDFASYEGIFGRIEVLDSEMIARGFEKL